MSEPNARRPVRLEDLSDGLAWPVLLKLAGLSLRWSRLLVAWAAGLVVVLVWRWKPAALDVVWSWVMREYLAAVGIEGMDRVDGASAVSLGEQLQALGTRELLIGGVVVAALVLVLSAVVAMLSRSTALEVARGLEVSPRYMAGWLWRRPMAAVVWMWWAPAAVVLGLVPGAGVWLAMALGEGAARSAVMVVVAPVALGWLVLSVFAALSSPLMWGAAASDIGDDIDRTQRTMAVALSHPVRLLVCYAWTALVGFVLLSVYSGLVWALVSMVIAAGGPEMWPAMEWALLPLRALGVGIAISVLAGGVTLSWLYLRRVGDEQDYSEVPVDG
ncbi:MAG: hypothetical protein ACTS3F_00435 [Phycisphaerales bacterium]